MKTYTPPTETTVGQLLRVSVILVGMGAYIAVGIMLELAEWAWDWVDEFTGKREII